MSAYTASTGVGAASVFTARSRSSTVPPRMDYTFRDVLCNLCEIDDAEVLGVRRPRSVAIARDLETRIVRCRRCGLIYPNPMPFADPDQLQAQFEDLSYFPSPVDEQRVGGYLRMVERIEKALGRTGRLLDVGCGRGELIAAATQRGWRAVGFEVSAAFARYARQYTGTEIFTGK